jgi:hypothetical protein
LLYFISEHFEENLRLQPVNNGIRRFLGEKKIEFEEIASPLSYEGYLKKMPTQTEPTQDAIWLLADTRSMEACHLQEMPGRKYAHFHSGNSLTPDFLAHINGVFAASQWDKDRITTAYPALEQRVYVCGFPFYPPHPPLHSKQQDRKQKRLVAFNQSFCLENLHILEVYLSGLLRNLDCKVIHLSPVVEQAVIGADPEAHALMLEGQKNGMEFIFYTQPEEYHWWLSQADVSIATTIDHPDLTALIEASTLGATCLAPNRGPFPEFLAEENLYSPYNLAVICEKAAFPPQNSCCTARFNPESVYKLYAQVMGVS